MVIAPMYPDLCLMNLVRSHSWTGLHGHELGAASCFIHNIVIPPIFVSPPFKHLKTWGLCNTIKETVPHIGVCLSKDKWPEVDFGSPLVYLVWMFSGWSSVRSFCGHAC